VGVIEFLVRFPGGVETSLFDQTGSGTHPASYPISIEDSFPGGKAAGEADQCHTTDYCHLRSNAIKSSRSLPMCP
jgi:hypothetical protein